MPTRRERNAQLEAIRQRETRQRRYLMIGLGLVVLVVIFVGSFAVMSAMQPSAPAQTQLAQDQGQCGPVQSLPSQGGEHIAPNQSHPPYSSNPPTSGWHWDTPKDWGIYTTVQVQEQLVHNLEHGGIVIQYRDLAQSELNGLSNLVQHDRYHLILAPYPELPQGKVALTAWTRLQVCQGVDEGAIRAFINAYRDKGPESVP